MSLHPDDHAWLLNQTAALLLAVQVPALNGTRIFTPDSQGVYGAQWSRDFAYAVRNTPAALWEPNALREAVRYTFSGQRADGCIGQHSLACVVAWLR